MRDPRFQELISAYVDGELSGDERLLVERELSESPESQQFYEHLLRQRQLLAELPRMAAPVGFADRVMRRLEGQIAVPPSAEVRVARQESNTRRRRWSINIAMATATVAAAGLLVTILMRDGNVDRPLKPRPDELVIKKADPTLRLAAFQERFRFLFVYDISITPKGRENRLLDQWLEGAKINLGRTVEIENKLEAGVLESRFIGDEKIVAGDQGPEAKDSVEMILVRGTAGQIDAISREWFKIRGREQDEVNVRIDMAMAPKELEIFLRLNDAVDGDETLGQVSSDSWIQPGAFRLSSRTTLQSSVTSSRRSEGRQMTSARNSAAASPLSVALTANQNPANAELENALPAMTAASMFGDENEPSQALIIVRNLKKDVVFPAVRGAAVK